MRQSQELKTNVKSKGLLNVSQQHSLQQPRCSLHIKSTQQQPSIQQSASTPFNNHKSSYSFGDPYSLLPKQNSINDKISQKVQTPQSTNKMMANNTIEAITAKYQNIDQISLSSKYSTSSRGSQDVYSLKGNPQNSINSKMPKHQTPDQFHKKQQAFQQQQNSSGNSHQYQNNSASTSSNRKLSEQQNIGQTTPKPFAIGGSKENNKKGSESSLFKDLKSQYQYQQSKKIEEIHIMIDKANDQSKVTAFKEKEQDDKALCEKHKEYRKCCQTCKDVPDDALLDKYLQASTEEAYQIQQKAELRKASIKCNCKIELSQLKAQLLSEQKLREFYQKQLQELHTQVSDNTTDPYSEYMKQFKQMQQRINEKNTQIQDLNTQLTSLNNIFENFKYVASLNYEYFALNLGDGVHKYTEIEKVELEKLYMEISKFNLTKKDQGTQVNIKDNHDDQMMLKSLKESMDLEREFQSIINENQILKQKLYSKTLDQKSINFKIQELKDELDDSADSKRRLQSQLVEKFADFVFKLNNLGVPDIKKEISSFTLTLFEFQRVFSSGLSEKDFMEWIYKVYLQMVEASGISRDRWGRKKTKGDDNSLSKSVQDLGGFLACNQSTTLSAIQKSFNKEQAQISKINKEEDIDQQFLLQIMNAQAHAIEQQIFDL